MTKPLLTSIAGAIWIVALPCQQLIAWDLPDYSLTESDLTEILKEARKLGVDTSQPLLSYGAKWRPGKTIKAEFQIQAGEPGERYVKFQTLLCVWEINYNWQCEFYESTWLQLSGFKDESLRITTNPSYVPELAGLLEVLDYLIEEKQLAVIEDLSISSIKMDGQSFWVSYRNDKITPCSHAIRVDQAYENDMKTWSTSGEFKRHICP